MINVNELDLVNDNTITRGLIAHATSNEHRLSEGGEIGDQCGHELCACKWFDAGWTAIYAAPNAEARERMAKFAEDAVTNGYFGYSQNRKYRRNFIYKMQEEEINFHPELVNINRVCDCSSLIYGAILAAGYAPYQGEEDETVKDENGNEITIKVPVIPNTKGSDEHPSIADYMKNTLKFSTSSDPKYLRTHENLKRGYVLYYPGHIAIWI